MFFNVFHLRRESHRHFWPCKAQGPTAWNNQSAHWGLVIAENRCAALIDIHVDSPSSLNYDGDRYSGASSKPHKALGKSRWHIGLNQEPISKQARKNWFTMCSTRVRPWPYQAIQAATQDTTQRNVPIRERGTLHMCAHDRTCKHEPCTHIDAYVISLNAFGTLLTVAFLLW